jgi:tRNA A-37 threonylcarbamoyl transferase component Bud32
MQGMALVIDVGQVLDKYELLERVGQGGMAVVYRGLDRSLRRQVAIKVLHRHLSEHQEARDRFEREAHAVAKLHHENILEIFDYSGGGSNDSYIVTEFIEGATLKQFVTDHPPRFAEIGAMVVQQIGRALAHAHAHGILHRDVKPENVMIRSDGVVKLTDFGISQMLDVQRLTVTGQLLGSPAYMSPEHVEGKPLDFRTDVFAAGIVLYQLTVGKLPFEGRNPHEILKRIGECKFTDPRQANPRVGNELGKIILRAMARDPDDRYPDITEMVSALGRYLDGSGLGDSARELSRYFQAAASYELALQQRLVDHLTRRGREALMAGQHAAALELFDRILTIEPGNPAVLGLLDGMARRRRGWHLAVAAAGLLAVAGGAWSTRRWLFAPPVPLTATLEIATPPSLPITGYAAEAPRTDQPVVAVDAIDAGPLEEPGDDRPTVRPPDVRGDADAGQGDAAPGGTAVVVVSPPDSEIRVGDGPWQKADAGKLEVAVSADVVITARNDACCEAETRTLKVGDAGQTVMLSLAFLPARVVPRCPVAEVRATVDGRAVKLDQPAAIIFGDSTQMQRTVDVEFVGETIDKQRVTVTANETVDVTCALR